MNPRILSAIALLVLVAGLSVVLLKRGSGFPERVPSQRGLDSDPQELARQLAELEAKEAKLDATLWARERLAQRAGGVFDALWDSLNASTSKLDVLATFPFREITIAAFEPPQVLRHGIILHQPGSRHENWSPAQWREFLSAQGKEGWRLAQAEFRHTRFETDGEERPSRSLFYFSAHLTNRFTPRRAAFEGELVVLWSGSATRNAPESDAPSGGALPQAQVERIDATRLVLTTRSGEVPFQPLFVEEVVPVEGSYFIDPLILYDLDRDGLSEIILAAKNLVFRRTPEGRYAGAQLCEHPPGLVLTALVGDFDGDGQADLLCAQFGGITLFSGSASGSFPAPGRVVWRADPHLKYAQAMTSGDVDGDGDLDVWLGQYKVPYERGQMPTPYYDANDGHPSYLLLNDGRGSFSEATVGSGLGAKRSRRVYSASFADLDDDRDLDLAVISDFAGLDLYENDGQGRFRDVTTRWVAERRAFGMAHTLADFDRDGRLDLLMIGMNSPTADRLEYAALARPEAAAEGDARRQMAFGNRLYLRRDEPRPYQQTRLNDSIARSGWSWGCSAFDFDNDGFPEVYIANGHQTKQSVREYEPEIWLQDAYVSGSGESIVATAFFGSKFARTRGQGFSFGGYEKNRLYLNQSGEQFLEAAHLLGVALEQDSRSVVADDLNGDGQMDLLVTTFEAWPRHRQALYVFQNELSPPGNWIGFRLQETGPGRSPAGARVTLRYGRESATRQIVTGDSYRAQHANTVHFGIGEAARVDSVEVRWPNAQTVVLSQPEINRYHLVVPP